MKTKTFNQLSKILSIFKQRDLSPYHPLIMKLSKFEEIEEEIVEMKVDYKYSDEEDIEEREAIKEEIDNLEKRKRKQWNHLMESFVIDNDYWKYLK